MTQKKIALITGANRGIGLETARQLGAKGIKVLIGARSEEKGLEAESALRNEGLDVEFVKIDVDDPATHESARKYIEATSGPPSFGPARPKRRNPFLIPRLVPRRDDRSKI